MKPNLRENLQQAGLLFGGASWVGTAPWCKGECAVGEVEAAVAPSGHSTHYASLSNFGGDCYIGEKALCTSQYSSCKSCDIQYFDVVPSSPQRYDHQHDSALRVRFGLSIHTSSRLDI
ncbi:hypothetical protein DACRYDRAFT_25565 [Dacryopinax primogenitus]|uniref:Uncharacterized protein n=1 Tax=Dacryopinax primogenitus (strain DJM 731) TaxID=1858805 RepID=M5FN07_DACPD|nr:uncharacterized protein DACRYDRAFT_25565 [Dacryopinax primogenitus]EJT96615.1 hypothetical protein DACRYDRAFT_25565 [Dacryopinax primogenitus]